MEMGGTVYITCEKTGLQSEIEFKTKVCAATTRFAKLGSFAPRSIGSVRNYADIVRHPTSVTLQSRSALLWWRLQPRGGQDQGDLRQEEDSVHNLW